MDAKEALKLLGIVVAETVVFVIVLRILSKPDALITIRLKTFRGLETVCENNARGWAHAADGARVLYDHSRSVV